MAPRRIEFRCTFNLDRKSLGVARREAGRKKNDTIGKLMAMARGTARALFLPTAYLFSVSIVGLPGDISLLPLIVNQ